jgi:hypothetical protein
VCLTSMMRVSLRTVDMVPSHPGPPLGWDGSSCPTQRPHTPTVHAFGTLGRSGRLRQVRSVGMIGYLGCQDLGCRQAPMNDDQWTGCLTGEVGPANHSWGT